MDMRDKPLHQPDVIAPSSRAANLPRVALVWAQFIPSHTDRCRAVQSRLRGRADVAAIEVASTSVDYGAFATSDPPDDVEYLTLFRATSFESVPAWRRFCALFKVTFRQDLVCIGIPYTVPEVLPLVLLLRLTGVQVILVYDTKFDDRPRSAGRELIKSLALSVFSGAIVASARSRDYLRFLGFRRRRVMGGTNGVSTARIVAEAGQAVPAFADRDFLFVGRFVREKSLDHLIASFKRYIDAQPGSRRRLVLVGSGPLEAELRAQVSRLDLADRVTFAGFRTGADLAKAMSAALALVLVSHSESWGFVINEAAALGLPLIVSEAPGARDVLVRNLVNGLVVPNGSRECLAAAMAAMASDETTWRAMSTASRERAWLGDSERFADAVELLLDPGAEPARANMDRYLATFDEVLGYGAAASTERA